MNNFFRTIIAGWGAKKLGGGCLSTIVIFVLIYSLLGKCNNKAKASVPVSQSKACLKTATVNGSIHIAERTN